MIEPKPETAEGVQWSARVEVGIDARAEAASAAIADVAAVHAACYRFGHNTCHTLFLLTRRPASKRDGLG